MNVVWLALIVIAIVIAAFGGRMEEVTNAAMESAGASVELAIGLIGVMALWLGLMRIAEEAGLIQMLAKALRPLLKRIFPEVPAGHPAMGSMLSNIAANMLGLGNSATALGLRAMQDLQQLNRDKKSASNTMATFLAINTSSVTLIPATVIAIRASADSSGPAEIIGPVIVATLISTTVGITAARLLQRIAPKQDAGPPADSGSEPGAPTEPDRPESPGRNVGGRKTGSSSDSARNPDMNLGGRKTGSSGPSDDDESERRDA